MPRRYFMYVEQYTFNNQLSTIGAFILGFSLFTAFANLFVATRKGKPVGANPWGVLGLEWKTTSPPNPHNFSVTPEITHGPYDYDKVLAKPTLDL